MHPDGAPQQLSQPSLLLSSSPPYPHLPSSPPYTLGFSYDRGPTTSPGSTNHIPPSSNSLSSGMMTSSPSKVTSSTMIIPHASLVSYQSGLRVQNGSFQSALQAHNGSLATLQSAIRAQNGAVANFQSALQAQNGTLASFQSALQSATAAAYYPFYFPPPPPPTLSSFLNLSLLLGAAGRGGSEGGVKARGAFADVSSGAGGTGTGASGTKLFGGEAVASAAPRNLVQRT